jgi:hypothetical protein
VQPDDCDIDRTSPDDRKFVGARSRSATSRCRPGIELTNVPRTVYGRRPSAPLRQRRYATANQGLLWPELKNLEEVMKLRAVGIMALAAAASIVGCASLSAVAWSDDCFDIVLGEVEIDCEDGSATFSGVTVTRKANAPSSCPYIGERCVNLYRDSNDNGMRDPGEDGPPPIKGSAPSSTWSTGALDVGPGDGKIRCEIRCKDDAGNPIIGEDDVPNPKQ